MGATETPAATDRLVSGSVPAGQWLDPLRRFKITHFDQIKLPSGSNYLVKDVLPRDGLTIVWGPPKCGKSFYVFDLVMSIALGQEYRGRKVKKGTVIYIALEGELGLSARTEAFRREKISDNTGSIEFYLMTTKLDLAADASTLADEIKEQLDGGCVCIVIDTLNRSLNGSESSDFDMSQWIRGADTLRMKFQCAVLVIHHCGHEQTRPRGHTSLLGAADAQIAVSRSADGVISAIVEYMKDGAAGAIFNSTLRVVELGENEDGDSMSSCVIDECDNNNSYNKKAVEPVGQAKKALELLHNAIDEIGEVPPDNKDIPKNKKAIKVEEWRRYCDRGLISDGKSDTQSKAFRRSTERLQALGKIGFHDGWVWPC